VVAYIPTCLSVIYHEQHLPLSVETHDYIDVVADNECFSVAECFAISYSTTDCCSARISNLQRTHSVLVQHQFVVDIPTLKLTLLTLNSSETNEMTRDRVNMKNQHELQLIWMSKSFANYVNLYILRHLQK